MKRIPPFAAESSAVVARPPVPAVPLYGRFEAAFFAGTDVEAPCDVELLVDFSGPRGARQTVRAFWFGSREWRVRFMPRAAGPWAFRTRSSGRIAGLHARRGAFTCTPAPSGETNPFLRHGPLRLGRGRRHLAHHDGTPFFWLGDTVWNGPTLVRSDEDWARFLDHRVAQKFNVIQFVTTQWRTAPTNAAGEVAYSGREHIWINPHWFERIDRHMDAIAAHGMLAAPVLIWTLGRSEINPATLPESEIIKLARYMVARYGAHPVVWLLNGDGRYHGEAAEKWRRIGRAVFDLPGHAPVAQHPGGMQWPHDAFDDESWIDVIGYQSGHGDDAETLQWIHSGPPARKWRGRRPRPCLNLEPPYEDHICYQSRRRHDAYSVRRAAWWSLLNAPPAGLTYGAHGVWSWEETAQAPADHPYTGVAQPWHRAMHLPGAGHMTHLADFFRALPWWQLAPAPDLLATPAKSPAHRRRRIHLVFTRNIDGETALWVDGTRRAAGWVGGDFSTWVDATQLALGNESTGDFGWSGVFHRAALYDRALGAGEIAAAQEDLASPRTNPLAAWTFTRRGKSIRDHAGRCALDLAVLTPARVRWTRRGLALADDAEIKSAPAPAGFTHALRAANALSVELLLTPAEWNARAAGRILSLQLDRWNRNLAITQVGTEFTAHVRTSTTAGNAEPSLATAVARSAFEFIAATTTPDRSVCVLYLPVGGPVRLNLAGLRRACTASWFDPRRGRHQPARPRGQTFVAPDNQDWVLVIQRR